MNKLLLTLTIASTLAFTIGCKEIEELTKTDTDKEEQASIEKKQEPTPSINVGESEPTSVEAIENTLYDGDARIKVSSVGVAFTIPGQWRGGLSKGSFALENVNIGYIIVVSDDASETESRELMSDTMDMGDGVFLQPEMQVSKNGNRLSAEYEVFGTGQPSVAYVVKLFSDNNNGFVLIGLGLVDKKSALKTAIDSMANSMTFFQPSSTKVSDTSLTGPNNRNNYWAQQLSGMKLTYFNTQSGFSEKFVITLCSSGAFSRSSNTSGFDNGGFSAALQGGGDGSWSTSGDQSNGELQLNYIDGDVGSYSIEVNDEGLFLNGERYYREDAGC